MAKLYEHFFLRIFLEDFFLIWYPLAILNISGDISNGKKFPIADGKKVRFANGIFCQFQFYQYRKKVLQNLLKVQKKMENFIRGFMWEKKNKPIIVWIKTNNNAKWLFYGYFWPFFRQLYVYLSQNWDSEGHFDVLNRSKIWLVLRLWHKMQIFPLLVCCNIVQKHAFEFFAFLHFVS